jgi:hypothetical protein
LVARVPALAVRPVGFHLRVRLRARNGRVVLRADVAVTGVTKRAKKAR